MPIGASDAAEPDTVEPLAAWLSDCTGEPVDPGAVVVNTPSSGGWSNDTWLVDTGGREHPMVVVRLEPTRAAMFPTYDLARQVLCLDALGDEAAVPTPRLLGVDLAGSRLGRPAFVMQHVDGRVPSDDRPTFAESGWLRDASPDEQRRFHSDLLAKLVAVHDVELRPGRFDALRRGGPADSNTAAIEDLRALWEWDRGTTWPAVIDASLAALGTAMPEPGDDVLLWGDARPANVVVPASGFEAIALLDWELATLGTPERDVTWLLEMNWVRIEGAGHAPLDGFLSDAESVALYQHSSGRRLRDLRWYRSLAAVRVAILMHRYLRAMVHADRLPPDHHLFTGTVASRRLDQLAIA